MSTPFFIMAESPNCYPLQADFVEKVLVIGGGS
jgi:hypothetical protein